MRKSFFYFTVHYKNNLLRQSGNKTRVEIIGASKWLLEHTFLGKHNYLKHFTIIFESLPGQLTIVDGYGTGGIVSQWGLTQTIIVCGGRKDGKTIRCKGGRQKPLIRITLGFRKSTSLGSISETIFSLETVCKNVEMVIGGCKCGVKVHGKDVSVGCNLEGSVESSQLIDSCEVGGIRNN